jgi:hypothetical protein
MSGDGTGRVLGGSPVTGLVVRVAGVVSPVGSEPAGPNPSTPCATP